MKMNEEKIDDNGIQTYISISYYVFVERKTNTILIQKLCYTCAMRCYFIAIDLREKNIKGERMAWWWSFFGFTATTMPLPHALRVIIRLIYSICLPVTAVYLVSLLLFFFIIFMIHKHQHPFAWLTKLLLLPLTYQAFIFMLHVCADVPTIDIANFYWFFTQTHTHMYTHILLLLNIAFAVYICNDWP